MVSVFAVFVAQARFTLQASGAVREIHSRPTNNHRRMKFMRTVPALEQTDAGSTYSAFFAGAFEKHAYREEEMNAAQGRREGPADPESVRRRRLNNKQPRRQPTECAWAAVA